MNNIIKIARIQTSTEPNNIIKVAGVLGKIKKWVLSLFDSSTREQIALIDSKYAELQPLILQLQQDIVNIENSIDEVDVSSYDQAVISLNNTLKLLSEKTKETQEQISNSQNNKKSLAKIDDPEIINAFSNTLNETGISSEQIKYGDKNLQALLSSLENNKHFSELFEDKEPVLQTIKEQLENKIVSIIGDFKINKILKPLSKETFSSLKNICILELFGDFDVDVNNNKYKIYLKLIVDVFVNNEKDIKGGKFSVFKQHVVKVSKE